MPIDNRTVNNKYLVELFVHEYYSNGTSTEQQCSNHNAVRKYVHWLEFVCAQAIGEN